MESYSPVEIVWYIDALLLMELLGNLIDNAVAYGAVNGKINVKLIAGPQLCLQVQYDGVGIPDSKQERIFEHFTVFLTVLVMVVDWVWLLLLLKKLLICIKHESN